MDSMIVYQVFTGVFGITATFAIGYYLGYRRSFRRFASKSASDREEMLTIERSLKTFWDHERDKLEQEKAQLLERIGFLEKLLDRYRQKAAGIGMMGLRKNKLTDMLISLLLENETLEEKLFLQNVKLKEERDEFLESQLQQISYKRILLSELIAQKEVRREMERIIGDKGRWKAIEIKKEPEMPTLAELEDEEGEASPT